MSDEEARRGVRFLLNGGLCSLSDDEFERLWNAVDSERQRRIQAFSRGGTAVSKDLSCPSCKHGIIGHMRDKHRGWESRYRPHCSQIGCGCGISQEEIEEHHARGMARQARVETQASFSYDQDNAD